VSLSGSRGCRGRDLQGGNYATRHREDGHVGVMMTRHMRVGNTIRWELHHQSANGWPPKTHLTVRARPVSSFADGSICPARSVLRPLSLCRRQRHDRAVSAACAHARKCGSVVLASCAWRWWLRLQDRDYSPLPHHHTPPPTAPCTDRLDCNTDSLSRTWLISTHSLLRCLPYAGILRPII
jgi:hypothetical protein